MNQITLFNQLLKTLSLQSSVMNFFMIAFSTLVIIAMTISVLEKIGILKLITNLFIKNNNTEHELKVLDELINFKKFETNELKNHPYAQSAYILKEINLLNNYFQTNINDLFALNYIFSRQDNKRASRLYTRGKMKFYLNKTGDGYILKPFWKAWLVYSLASIWFTIYIGMALYLFVFYFVLGNLREEIILGIIVYFLIIFATLVVGWFTSPLIWPMQAKIFAELKKRNLNS